MQQPASPATIQMGATLLGVLGSQSATIIARDLKSMSLAEWRALVALAIQYSVAPLLYQQLQAAGWGATPPELRLELENLYFDNVVRNMQFYHAFGAIIAALREEQIQVIALKGVHLAAQIYTDIGLRKMIDIDLLVRPPDALRAGDLLQRRFGYAPLLALEAHAEMDAYLPQHHLPRLVKEEAPGIEVHTHITHPDRPYAIAIDELWLRARPVMLADVETLTLSHEDLLLHVCLHAAYHHQLHQGVRFLCDVTALLQRCQPLDWIAVVERAKRWQWERGVYLSLLLAKELMDAAVPAETLSVLQPAGFDRRIVAEAFHYLFATHDLYNPLSDNIARLWSAPSWRGKAIRIGQTLFPPRRAIARDYRLPAGSPLIWFCYPIRAVNLVLRSGNHLNNWRRLRADAALQDTLQRRSVLYEWLGWS